MSSSDATATHAFNVDLDLNNIWLTPDDVTLTIYNGVDEVVHRGAGPADLSLPTGLYTVRAEFASEFVEQVVRHTGPTIVPIRPERHAAAPLEGTATSHEYYSANSASLSRQETADPLGQAAAATGRLFIFIRAADRHAHHGQDLRLGLSLRRPHDGRILTAFEEGVQWHKEYGYLAYSVRAEPGVYVLEYSGQAPRQMPVYVYSGWQTQVFVVFHGRPLIESATILLARNEAGFDPHDRLAYAMDMAISGLQNDAELMPNAVMWELLNAKFDNPMLGMLGAHILLRRPTPDPSTLSIVLGNLEHLLPGAPDVRALRLMADLRFGDRAGLGAVTFDTPPMIRAGFAAAIAADAEVETILPDGGWLEQVALLVYADSPWTTWAPPPASLAHSLLADQAAPYRLFFSATQQAVTGQAPVPPAEAGWIKESLGEALARGTKTGQPPAELLRKFARDFNVPLRLVKRAQAELASAGQAPAANGAGGTDEAVEPPPARPWQPGPPVFRRLRGYALDPGLAQQFETAPVSQVTFKIPWEPLEPGPVGEYLEVIDYDPAGKCFYEPVSLDDPFLLAQSGLPPSEGTPQFHQQMVYAVARLTIHNFERALGRRALWSPGPSPNPDRPFDDSHYVPRLRIYPHALREANAYYSPAKKALLFGYFPAAGDDWASHVPGSMIFTCLSHDIIAHETAHALLDGLHRRLNRATNPDMLAFHEAFADIVALFQHFTFPEILRHQIARTRGDIRSQETLLGQLAGQFGRATGARSALRDAIGRTDRETGQWVPHPIDAGEYARTLQPHQRGAILVAAVFDAFLTIYNNRTADLRRLYTGGTGVLPAGAVHPDLVDRLSDEANKAATHVLAMCVRALDYCPPVDLTFGEYLRALLTADADLVRNDDRNYRVAFVEAFRRRGIFPRDVRTLSAENLVWRTPRLDQPQPSTELVNLLAELRDFGHQQLYAASREDLFHQARAARRDLQRRLRAHLRSAPAGRQDAAFLGLDPDLGRFEVHSLHFANRIGPDGDMLLQAVIQITQQKTLPAGQAPTGSPEPQSGSASGAKGRAGQPRMRFEGGSTIIFDLKKRNISYCIRKPVTSRSRPGRQAEFDQQFAGSSLQATYFGGHDSGRDGDARREPFALLHRAGG
jgi:hypothetical protein